MWAGGRVRTLRRLRCGAPATHRSQVLSVTEKQGPTGALTFVVARHQYVQNGQLVVDEEQDVVYRAPAALTYNAHRIHYARDVEGYPGLLTHGPLRALAMAEAARARGVGGRVSFSYRLVSPLFDHQGLIVRAEGTTTTARDVRGRQTATGTVRALG